MTFINIMRWLGYVCMIIGASQRSVVWLISTLAAIAVMETLLYLLERASKKELAMSTSRPRPSPFGGEMFVRGGRGVTCPP